MAQKKTRTTKSSGTSGNFYLNFKNDSQSLAWLTFKQHDVLFLLGPAGTGKTFLACAFAIEQILNKHKKKIILTRPIVEAGESLGFLPGEFDEKILPYMLPMYDCIDKLVGKEGPNRDRITQAVEAAPLAYMRGRAILNSENLITPQGLRLMGEIKVGDFVTGSDGQPTRVLAVYPQGKKPVYEVCFSDGTKSICSGDHLWSTMTLNEKRHNKGFSVKSTMDIISTVKNKHGQKIHRMPIMSAPAIFDEQPTPVHPYLLGALLGDGHISKSMSIASSDKEIIEKCESVLPHDHKIVFRGRYDYRIQSNGKRNKLKIALQKLGVWGKLSYDKFIPDIYKFNSVECRLEILRGLLDTDGSISKHRSGKPRIQFYSTSSKLAEDVMFLVRSLGGVTYKRERKFDESDTHYRNGRAIRHTQSCFVVDIMMPINPFFLPRKADQYQKTQQMTKMISCVKAVGEAECTCIKVEAKDSLFLTNDFIVTHNTFDDAICIFDEAQNASMLQLKLFLSRFGENSKIIITGDPSQSDLAGKVALVEAMQKLKGVDGIGTVEFKASAIVRHPLIATILEKLN